MAKQDVKIHRLDNGMTLVAETMKEVSSAAFVFFPIKEGKSLKGF